VTLAAVPTQTLPMRCDSKTTLIARSWTTPRHMFVNDSTVLTSALAVWIRQTTALMAYYAFAEVQCERYIQGLHTTRVIVLTLRQRVKDTRNMHRTPRSAHYAATITHHQSCIRQRALRIAQHAARIQLHTSRITHHAPRYTHCAIPITQLASRCIP